MSLIYGRLYYNLNHSYSFTVKQMVIPIFANSLNFFVRKTTGIAQIILLGDLLIQVPTLKRSRVSQKKKKKKKED